MSDSSTDIRDSRPVPVAENKPVGVNAKEREGVFINGFICQYCGLHFNLFSWKADRHRSANTYCPECGRKGSFLHYRKILSTKQTRAENSKEEIFGQVPWPGSKLVNDSVIFSDEARPWGK